MRAMTFGSRARLRVRKMAVIFLATLGLTAAVSLAPLPSARPVQTALAGSNGQQLVFTDAIGDVYSICIAGTNDLGESFSNYCWSTPNLGRNNPPSGSPYWVGIITITQRWFTGNAFRIARDVGPIPRSQSYTYWCYDDYVGGSGEGCN
jgi:hypothetical protein